MIWPRIGLSPRRRLPIFYVWGADTFPQTYLKFTFNARSWEPREKGSLIECRHLGDHLFLNQSHAFLAILEWGTWVKTYLPRGKLKGEKVLDVGAGCGETAHFFLKNGASHVLGVEADVTFASIFRRNAELNGWDCQVIQEPFSLTHLRKLDFDYMKMDIEGGEAALLSVDRLPPSVIEVHTPNLTKKLVDKFGMKVLKHDRYLKSSIISNL